MSSLCLTTLRVAPKFPLLRNAIHVQGRAYASTHGVSSKMKTSDAPWLATAAVGTIGGLYLASNRKNGHENSKQAKAQRNGVNTNNGDDKSPSQGHANTKMTVEPSLPDKRDDASDPNSQNRKSNERLGEKRIEKKTDSDQAGAGRPDPGEEAGLVGHGPKESKKTLEPGAVSPDVIDKPDPRGKPASANHMSGKQEGLSNADTHHTSQVSHQPEKSKKGEGVAESAKLKGTVSTNRPGPENKEERGKAQMNKDV